jgi:hypothetical protein
LEDEGSISSNGIEGDDLGRAIAVRPPTARDVSEFLSFLEDTDPELFDAVDRAARGLQDEGVDLRRLRDRAVARAWGLDDPDGEVLAPDC